MKRVRDSFIGLGLARTAPQDGEPRKRHPLVGLVAFALGFVLAVLILWLVGVRIDSYAPLIVAFTGGFAGLVVRLLIDKRGSGSA